MARTTIATPGFLDCLGDRVVVTDRSGGDLEVLRLRHELTGDAAFEASLKARAERLAAFQHRAAARVRGISRLPGSDGRLAVVSDVARGWRLSEVLQAAEHEGRLFHTSTVLFLLRQIASVVAALQACGPEISHGALGPERIVLTPVGRVLVVEYVLGSALEHVPALPADRIWKEFRLAVPPAATSPRFGPATDVVQLGVIALSLVHNRLLKRDEYPGHVAELIDSATESQVTGARQPLGRPLRDWLERALGLVSVAPAWVMADAQRGLDALVSKDGGYLSTPVGLEPLLQSVERFFNVPPAPEPAERPQPAAGAETHRGVEAVPDAGIAHHAEVVAHHAGTAHHAEAVAHHVEAVAHHAGTAHHAEATAHHGPHAPAGEPAARRQPDAAAEPAAVTALAVRPPTGAVPAALPPATEMIARTLDPDGGLAAEDGLASADDARASLEALFHPTSPLAEFAGEHAADPSPSPGDAAADAGPRQPPHAVPPPLPASPPWPTEAGALAPEVGPVADMLSVDRPVPKRRVGWNGEAWLSRTTDRQPSGARAVDNSSSQTQRVSRSGSAPAAVARPRDAPAPTEPSGPHEAAAPSREASTPLSVAVQPASPSSEAAVATGSAPQVAAAREATIPARPPSVFDFADEPAAADVEDEPVEEAAHASWYATWIWPVAASLLILCAGGFAAWKLLSPSASAAVKTPAVETDAKAAPSARTEARGALTPARTDAAALAPATPAGEAASATGSLQLESAIVLDVTEDGQLLGTSEAPLPLAAGRHVLDLSNQELGFRATRVVDVRTGRVTRAAIALPNGSVNINATPWADVFVDGQRVGETPLANVSLTIGSHEVRFRHPQLGEQVRTVVITAGAPGRLSVDMKQ